MNWPQERRSPHEAGSGFSMRLGRQHAKPNTTSDELREQRITLFARACERAMNRRDRAGCVERDGRARAWPEPAPDCSPRTRV